MTKLLDLTLPQQAENLALDEALLDQAEAAPAPTQLLRLWEPAAPMVVVGRASKVHDEVQVDACREAGVPVYRRCSGGTAIVAGPGCLMYAVILSYERHPHFRQLDHCHAFVMGRMQAALSQLVAEVQYQGTCDLTIDGRKVSGNSLRCKRRHLLYHGTVLYNFPLWQISAWLATPPRQPDYRAGRSHREFVANLNVPVEEIRRAVIDAWDVSQPFDDWPRQATTELTQRQYSRREWTWRL